MLHNIFFCFFFYPIFGRILNLVFSWETQQRNFFMAIMLSRHCWLWKWHSLILIYLDHPPCVSSLSIVYLQYLYCLHCAIVSRHLAVPTAQSICSQCWRQRGFCARSFASSDSEDSVSQRLHTQFHKLFTSVNNSTLHCFLGNISASIGFRRRFGKRKRPHFSREIFCATFPYPYLMYIFLCPGMSPLISQVLLLIMLTLAHADGYSSLSLASPVLISIPMVFPPVLQACQTKTKTTQCQRQTDDGFTW